MVTDTHTQTDRQTTFVTPPVHVHRGLKMQTKYYLFDVLFIQGQSLFECGVNYIGHNVEPFENRWQKVARAHYIWIEAVSLLSRLPRAALEHVIVKPPPRLDAFINNARDSSWASPRDLPGTVSSD